MKEIKFLQEFIPQILSGQKTATRRPIKELPDNTYRFDYYDGKYEAIYGVHAINFMADCYKEIEPKYKEDEQVKIDGTDIILKITDAYPEQLSDMTLNDFIAEGLTGDFEEMKQEYEEIIFGIYPELKGQNPFMWVYEFEVMA